MARKKFEYQLVGSIYDPYASNPFQEQESITVPGLSLDCLEDIDFYTTQFRRGEFVEQLPSYYRDKTHFSILVFNNYQDSSYFIKVIFKDDLYGEEFASLIPSIRPQNVFLDDKYKRLALLPQSELVNKYWKKIENALEKRDVDTLGKYFSVNSSYYHKLIRYLNSGYDEGAEFRALENLKLEFRDYHIFRKAFVAENSYHSSYSASDTKKSSTTSNSVATPMAEFSVDEEEYRSSLTQEFNLQGENEEFLTPREYAECNPGFEDIGPPQYVRKKNAPRKPLKNSHDEN